MILGIVKIHYGIIYFNMINKNRTCQAKEPYQLSYLYQFQSTAKYVKINSFISYYLSMLDKYLPLYNLYIMCK